MTRKEVQEAFADVGEGKKYFSAHTLLQERGAPSNYIPYFFGDSTLYPVSNLPKYAEQDLQEVFTRHLVYAKRMKRKVFKKLNSITSRNAVSDWCSFILNASEKSLSNVDSDLSKQVFPVNAELREISINKIKAYLQDMDKVTSYTGNVLDRLVGQKRVNENVELLRNYFKQSFLNGEDIKEFKSLQNELLKDFFKSINQKFITNLENSGLQEKYEKELSANEKTIVEAYAKLTSLSWVAHNGNFDSSHQSALTRIFLNTKSTFMQTVSPFVGRIAEEVACGVLNNVDIDVKSRIKESWQGSSIKIASTHTGQQKRNLGPDILEDSFATRSRKAMNFQKNSNIENNKTEAKADYEIKISLQGERGTVTARAGFNNKNSIHIVKDPTSNKLVYASNRPITLWTTTLMAALQRKQVGYTSEDIRAFIHVGTGHGKNARTPNYKPREVGQLRYTDKDIQAIWDKIIHNLKARVIYTALVGTTEDRTIYFALNGKLASIEDILLDMTKQLGQGNDIDDFISASGAAFHRRNYLYSNKWLDFGEGNSVESLRVQRSANANLAVQALMSNAMLKVQLKAAEVNRILSF